MSEESALASLIAADIAPATAEGLCVAASGATQLEASLLAGPVPGHEQVLGMVRGLAERFVRIKDTLEGKSLDQG